MLFTTKRRIIMGAVFILLVALVLSNYFFNNFYYFLVEFLLTVICLLGLYYLDMKFKLNFEARHYLYIIIILFAGILFSPIYYFYYSYDKILHFTVPIVWCLVVFYLVDRLKISFSLKLLFTFTIVMTSITFLEIVEYSLDTLFGHTFQGVYATADFRTLRRLDLVLSRIDDTMIDMILGASGSLLFVVTSAIARFYKKRHLKKTKKKKH